MSAVTKPRGPLPARVYWTRRVLALVLALGLVFGTARLLGSTTSESGGPTARPAAAETTTSVPSGEPTSGSSSQPSPRPSSSPTATSGDEQPSAKSRDEQRGQERQRQERRDKSRPERTPLAVPTGPCEDDDVKVTPIVDQAFAYQETTIGLELTTLESPACTWDVSEESVVLRITSGSDAIWTTQDCREAVPEDSVVVRKDHPAEVEVGWSGLRSDEGCTRTTPWAEPGYYHATAAALGGDPTDVQFQLEEPEPEPEPDKRKTDKSRDRSETKREDRADSGRDDDEKNRRADRDRTGAGDNDRSQEREGARGSRDRNPEADSTGSRR